MLRILNCVVDDVFIDPIIDSFDLFSRRCSNDYIIVRENISTNYKDIKQKERVGVVKPSDFILYVNNGRYDAIIIHSLRPVMYRLLPLIDRKVIVVWKAWGFDIYSSPHIYDPFVKINLYKPLTKKFIDNSNKKWLRDFYGYCHYLMQKRHIHKAISRIDFFSGVFKCEYEFMQRLSFFNADKVFCPYITKEHYINIMNQNAYVDDSIRGNNILIGNSNNPTNNHLDVFNVLKTIDIKDRKIICPLNYGGTKEYRRLIIETGYKYWGNNFIPIIKLLPREEYFNILRTCNVAIFNHERQQALGNILHAIWLGVSVYLPPNSVNHKELSSLGFKVFDFTNSLSYLNVLNSNEIINNRRLYSKSEYGKGFENAVNEMYNKIENKLKQNFK